jgi:hypothetical protein
MPICVQYDPGVDLEALNEKRIGDLTDREPKIAAKLDACCPEAPCGLLIYADSSRAARLPSRFDCCADGGPNSTWSMRRARTTTLLATGNSA